METFQERLFKEREDLQVKFEKLQSFIHGDKFSDLPEIQRSLLLVQVWAMGTYLVCLNQRLINLT